MAFGGLIVAFVGLITSFILQRDSKKLKELESENKKYRSMLLKALSAIKGYQAIEVDYAEKEGVDVKAYRSKIRKDKQELFNTSFLTPSRVDEIMKELES
ncbi:MAG: hypothetical protein FMNOHCHN_01543 [Ignavibacteriaceae bacterium]|nr:hypothetical protein [Ignavibacteriaceae bacterium]